MRTQAEPLEADFVIGTDLAHLPDLCAGDGGWADKAAQAGPIEHQRHRHITCVPKEPSNMV